MANGTNTNDAATFGQILAAGSYNISSDGADQKAQTLTIASNDGKAENAISITVAGEGAVAQNDQRLVNGDTVWNATVATGTVDLSADGNVIKNNHGDTLYTFTKVKDTLTDSETGFVSGADLWKETRAGISAEDTDNNYIDQDATAGANLKALDTKIGRASAGNYYAADEDVETQIQKVDAQVAKASKIVRVSTEKDNEILVGRDSGTDTDYANITVIDVGNNGTNATRRITGLTDGESNIDAATYGQIASANGGNAYTMDDEGFITVGTNAGGTAFKLKITDAGEVKAGNTGFVKGGQVWANDINEKEATVGEDGSVTIANNAGGTAFTIKGIGTGTDIVRVSTDESNKILVGRDKTGKNTYAGIDTIDVSNNGTRKISGVTAGTAVTDAANVGQLVKNDTYTLGANGVTVATNAGGEAFTLRMETGEIAGESTGFVSGGDIYDYLAPTAGTYVNGDKTTGENLEALDTKIGTITDADTEYINADYSVFKNLEELDKAIQNGSNKLISYDDENEIIKIGEDVEAGSIDMGGRVLANLTAGSKLTDAATFGQIAEANQTLYATADDMSAAQYGGNDQGNQILANNGSVLATLAVGSLAEDSYGFVSGKTAWEGDVASGIYSVKYNGETDDATGSVTIRNNAGDDLFTIDNIKTKLSEEEVTPYVTKYTGDNATIKVNTDEDSNTAEITTITGGVTAGSKALVTGQTMYNELRLAQGTKYNYIAYNQTTAQNLAALDSALTTQSKIVRLDSDGGSQILVGRDQNGETTFASVNAIDISNGGNKTRKLTGVTAGASITDAANYGQLVNSHDGQAYTMDNDGVITVNNNAGGVAFKMKIAGDGEIASGKTTFITGGKAYNELRTVTSKNYINKGNTTAENISALDAKIGAAQTADAGLYNAADDIETQIAKVAKARVAANQTVSLATTAGTNATNVIKDAAGNTLATFAAGSVASGSTGFVSGGQVWANDVSNNGGVAYEMDEDGIYTVKNNAGNTAFTLKLAGNGTIADGNEGFISGGTAYTYLNPTTGSYVKSGATTAANLEALDAKIGAEQALAGVYAATDSLEDKIYKVSQTTGLAKQTLSLANTNDSEPAAQTNVIRDLADNNLVTLAAGAVASGNTGFVSGGQVWAADIAKDQVVAVTYKAPEGSTDPDAEGIGSVTIKNNAGDDVFTITGIRTKITQGDVEKFITDYEGDGKTISVTPVTDESTGVSVNKISAVLGEIAASEVEGGGLVTGQMVHDYVTPTSGEYVKSDFTAGQNLNALDDAIAKQNKLVRVDSNNGSQILVGADKSGASDFANVTTINVGNNGVNRTITGVAAGSNTTDAANYGQIVSKHDGDPYTMDKDGLIKVSNNAGETAFSIQISGNGKIEANNTGLINGDTAYAYLNPEDGSYVKSGKTAAANLNALDTKIGAEKSGNYYGESESVEAKLSKLDTKIGTAIGVSNVYEATDSVETQISKTAQKLVQAGTISFADVDAGTNVIKDMAGNALITFTQGEVARGNNNLVSGGQVWDNDINAKEATVSADGSVTIKNNAGGDAFTIKGIGTGTGSNIVRVSTDNKNQILVGRDETGKTTYADIDTIDISNNGTRKLSGVTAGTANTDAANFGQLVKNDTYTLGANGVTVATNANGEAFTLKMETGEIAEGVNGFVSGGDIYDYLAPTTGNYVNGNQTTGENLKALDTKIGKLTGTNYEYIKATNDISANLAELDKAIQNSSNKLISYDDENEIIEIGKDVEAGSIDMGGRVLSNLANGSLNTDAATYGQIAAADQTLYATADDMTGTLYNGNDQGNQILANNGSVLATLAVGSLAEDSYGFVSGKTAWEGDVASGIYSVKYNGETDDATGSVTIRNNAGDDLFTIDNIKTKLSEEEVTPYVTKYTGDNATIKVNTDEDSNTAEITTITGGVTAGSKALVTGQTMYNELRLAQGTKYNYIAYNQTTAQNLAALDSALTTQSKIVRLDSDGGSQILVGRDQNGETTFASVNAIDISNGGNKTRKLTGVTAGASITDAANYGQLVNSHDGQAYTMDNDGVITVNNNAGGVAFKMKIAGDGEIASGKTTFITGGKAYNELRTVTSKNYINKGNTTAENISALDAKIGAAQTADAGLYNAADDIETQIAKVAKARVAANQTVSLATTAGTNATNVIKDAAGNTLATFAAGSVASGSTGFVSGGQVWANDVSNNGGVAYEMDEDGIYTVKNNAGNTAFTLKLAGNGTIADGNEGFISGGTAYTYLNPTTGSYVKSGATTAANLEALDAKIGAEQALAGVYAATDSLEDKIYKVSQTTGLAKQTLSLANTNDSEPAAQTNVIRDLADNNLVTLAAGAVASGNTGFVSGGQVWAADIAKDQVVAVTYKAPEGSTDPDAEGIGSVTIKNNAGDDVFTITGIRTKITQGDVEKFITDYEGDGKTISVTPVTDESTGVSVNKISAVLGEIAASEVEGGGLVTGQMVHDYVTPTSGEYVKSDFTAGQNLNALDDAIAKQNKLVRVDSNNGSQILVGADKSGASDFANVTTINVGNNGVNRTITGVAAGVNTTDAANVGQLVSQNNGNAYTMDKDGLVKVSNNAGDTAFSIQIFGNGKIADENKGLISGEQVYDELRPVTSTNYVKQGSTTAANLSALDSALYDLSQNAADTKLSNITTEGQTVISNLAKKAVKVEAGSDNVTVEDDGNGTYKVSFDSDAIPDVSMKADVDAGNIGKNLDGDETAKANNRDAWGVALGTMEVKSGSNELITSAGLYQETRLPDADGNSGYYMSVGNTAAQNMVALSEQIHTNEGNIAANATKIDALELANNTYTFNKTNSQQTVWYKDGRTAAFTIKIDGIGEGSGDSGSGTSYTVGNGIAIDNNVISANIGDGLAFNNGKIVANADGETIKVKDGALYVNANGAVAAGNTGLVTGDMVNAAIKAQLPVSDTTAKEVIEEAEVGVAGNYVDKEDSIKTDVEKLDTKLHDSDTKMHWDEAELGDNSSRSIAFGATGTNEDSTERKTTVTGQDSIAIGTGSQVTGDKSIAIGTGHTVVGNGSGAFGDPSVIYGDGSYAYGNNNSIGSSTSDVDNAFILGNNAKVTANNSVAIGYKSEASEENVISVGSADNLRRIINVAEATSDNEAVTYKQLVSYVKDNAGSGDGTKYTAGTGISISDGTISVKEGSIAEGDTGVVTGGDIYKAVGDTTQLAQAGLGENLTDSVLTVSNRISGLNDNINKAGAGAAALAALHPEAYDPNDKVSFAIGYGHYHNANATAIGAFYKPNADTTVSIGGTLGNGDSMMNAGVSFKLGARGAKGIYTSNVELIREVNNIRADTTALKNSSDAQARVIQEQARKIQNLESDNIELKRQIQAILARLEMSETVQRSARR